MSPAVTRLPFAQGSPLRIAPRLRELRAEGTVHAVRTATGDPAWLVTGHAQVRGLLDDDRLGRTHPNPRTAARTDETLFNGLLGNHATEAADHARIRTLLQPHFSPRNMRALRPRVESLTARLLDDLTALGPPADLHTALAEPLPILVVCELLGVPYADRARFRTLTADAAALGDPDRAQRGMLELFAYGRELVARKRLEPGDDVLSRLAATEGVPDDEIAGLSMALLFAGHETTVVHLGLGVLLLLAHPEQWRALVTGPELIPGAVEEILRASTTGTGGGIPRYAREDLDIDGTAVRAGDLVLLGNSAANHDPDAFPDPDLFDITRRAGAHVTFGHGARYCLGAPLARLELHTVLTQLTSRFPELRLDADPDTLTTRQDTLTGGLAELPVRW
ncbi:cytochrome P450 [Streptomyces sp. NPDC004539]|uniref:cytochrome P450 n=1 Tax=Streptomyces sp. NPDC004539 TaxID=3154280 RepID=UPI0033B9309C